MKKATLNVTTDASGDGSDITDAALGLLYAVQLIDGNFDDGVDVVITAEQGDLSIPLFSANDFNTDQFKYPRVSEHDAVGGAALTTTCMPLVAGRLKAVIAAGGNVKSGTFILHIID